MASPKLLLLDEPGAGLNPKEIRELMATLLKIKEEKKLSMIVVEHHMELVMNICTTLHVLDFGKKIAEGPARGDQGERAGSPGLPRGRGINK